ncbi:MAG: hypothetical protein HQ559_17200 [Lentisphaerae bacterium]|nr:hypothetical protein [Lentisphaerota bacterium]
MTAFGKHEKKEQKKTTIAVDWVGLRRYIDVKVKQDLYMTGMENLVNKQRRSAMRKMTVVMLAAVFLASVSGVLADDVKSVNAVGYVKTQIPDGDWALISLPFLTMDEDVTFTIEDIIPASANLVSTKAWFYRGGQWVAETLAQSGPSVVWSPGTNEFLRGQDSLFVNISTADDQPYDLTVLGEVPGDNNLSQTTTVVVAGGDWTLLGFGYPINVLVTNTELNTKAESADKIWTWNPDSDAWEVTATYLQSGPTLAWSPADAELQAGRGYYYDHTGGTLMNWVQDKKYDEP